MHNPFECAPSIFETLLFYVDLGKGERFGVGRAQTGKSGRRARCVEERKEKKRWKRVDGEGSRKKARRRRYKKNLAMRDEIGE